MQELKEQQKVIRHPDVITAEIKVVFEQAGEAHYHSELLKGKAQLLLQQVDRLHIERQNSVQFQSEKEKAKTQIIMPPMTEGAE